MRSDARLAAKYGPLVVTTLTRNLAREARARVVRKPLPTGLQLTDFDPFDPATAADPYPGYRKLLASGPVHYNPTRDIYILTRYADVRAGARADDALSSAEGVTYGRVRLPVLLTTDAPTHTRMRKQALPGFTRGALESWQPMIDRMAAELVETVTAASTCDVVPTLAAPMPMAIISHILGISEDDQSAFRDWSNETIRIADVNFTWSGLREMVPTLGGFRHLYDFFTDRLNRGELLSENTVLGKLTRNGDDGLSHEELFFTAVLLLLAGNETTTNLLSTLFLTLADYPDQLRLLQQRPELIPSAVEEQLRFISPIQSFYRAALVDYSVGDVTIPVGSRVLLAWGAANRDPRQFDDPDTFRADRNPTGHVAFGSGVHLCLGAQLARMEGQAVLREIVERVDRVEVTGIPAWTTNPNLRGLTRLRVAVTRRAAA